jgi:hypothetical protein
MKRRKGLDDVVECELRAYLLLETSGGGPHSQPVLQIGLFEPGKYY